MVKQNEQVVKSTEPATNKQDSIAGLLARIFWMPVGSMVLAISMISIILHKGRMFNAADWVFWITIAALILVRYLDIKFWGGQTAAGEPASIKHWRKYTIVLIVISAAIWSAAHLFKS
jgi:hypothetical protein